MQMQILRYQHLPALLFYEPQWRLHEETIETEWRKVGNLTFRVGFRFLIRSKFQQDSDVTVKNGRTGLWTAPSQEHRGTLRKNTQSQK